MHELARHVTAQRKPHQSERTCHLAMLEAYYWGSQYDGLPRAWNEDVDPTNQQPIPFLHRRPATVVPLPKLIVDSFGRSLWGAGRRPVPHLEDDQDAELLADLVREARLYRVCREATRRALSVGSCVVAWRLEGGRFAAQAWDSKWCRPSFAPGGETIVESIEYRFPFERELENERTGAVEKKTYWHREVVDAKAWTVYQPLESRDGSGAPPLASAWTADKAQSVEHGLGFCPVVWATVGERGAHDLDGASVYGTLLALFDDLNYTASQSGRALHYNLDPQTVLAGVDEASLAILRKAGANTWALPPGATAELLELEGKGLELAAARAEWLRKWCLDVAAVIINDPEKVSGAQSGAALALLCQPMLAAVEDLREDLGEGLFVRVLQQMLAACGGAALADRGVGARDRAFKRESKALAQLVEVASWRAVQVTLKWGPHFPSVPEDAARAAEGAVAASTTGLISQAAAARYVAPHFGVEDVDADQEEAQAEKKEAEERMVDIAGATADVTEKAKAEHAPPPAPPAKKAA